MAENDFETIGKGVMYRWEGTTLVIKLDSSQDFGKSSSKKSVIIASTSGNKDVGNGLKLGLNFYRPT